MRCFNVFTDFTVFAGMIARINMEWRFWWPFQYQNSCTHLERLISSLRGGLEARYGSMNEDAVHCTIITKYFSPPLYFIFK